MTKKTFMKEKSLKEEIRETEINLEQENNQNIYQTSEKEERNPLWYILSVFLILIIIAMTIPYYGIKLDPEPKNVPTIKDVVLKELTLNKNNTKEIGEIHNLLEPNDPEIKLIADKIVSESDCKQNKVCYAKAIYYFVKEKILYINDPPEEYIKNAKETITTGLGDCDDQSVLLANLMMAIGITTRFVIIPNHIYLEIYLPEAINRYKSTNEWVPLDPTCEYCKFGETPYKNKVDGLRYI